MINLRARLAIILVCAVACQSTLAQKRRNSNLYRNVPALGVVKLSFGGGISYYMEDVLALTYGLFNHIWLWQSTIGWQNAFR